MTTDQPNLNLPAALLALAELWRDGTDDVGCVLQRADLGARVDFKSRDRVIAGLLSLPANSLREAIAVQLAVQPRPGTVQVLFLGWGSATLVDVDRAELERLRAARPQP